MLSWDDVDYKQLQQQQQANFLLSKPDMAFSTLALLAWRQEGNPVCKKTEWWGAGMVIYLERGADLHMAQLMPLPLTVSCFSKNPDWFYLSGTSSPG